MDLDWTEEEQDFRRAVTAFASSELAGGDGSVEWFREAWKKCGAFGLQGLPWLPSTAEPEPAI